MNIPGNVEAPVRLILQACPVTSRTPESEEAELEPAKETGSWRYRLGLMCKRTRPQRPPFCLAS